MTAVSQGLRSVAKVQHYVAQSYLRQFASRRGKAVSIWCYDKQQRKAFETNVRNVGGEQYFYHGQSEVAQPLEALFGRVESAFSTARQRLIDAPEPASLADDDVASIALFIASQMVRTREHRQHVEEVLTRTAALLGDDVTPELREWLGPCDSEQARKQHIYNLTGDLVPELAQTIVRMKWILLRNTTPTPFWTSDHPVALYNPIDAQPRGNLGLRCRGIQLYLPLSPAVTLCTSDPISYGALPSAGNVVPDNVVFQNSLQVRSSARHLFSAGCDFRLAEEILKDHPDLADPSRRRLHVD
jgi:hypothetical protein